MSSKKKRGTLTPKMQTPPVRCLCGGTFFMGFDEQDSPFVIHSYPTCPAYDAIATTDDAVAFSQRNRAPLN